jgi:hypothetical protein
MHTTNMTAAARAKEELRVSEGIRRKQAKLRRELGPRFHAWKALARGLRPVLRW